MNVPRHQRAAFGHVDEPESRAFIVHEGLCVHEGAFAEALEFEVPFFEGVEVVADLDAITDDARGGDADVGRQVRALDVVARKLQAYRGVRRVYDGYRTRSQHAIDVVLRQHVSAP